MPKMSTPAFTRAYSSFSHVDSDGQAQMVDVSDKRVTKRIATARGEIQFSTPEVVDLIRSNSMKKGDVLGVARVAGIMAVKSTPTIIPLCHPIMITKIKNNVEVQDQSTVVVETTVQCDGKTGVEMEAITGAMASLVTVYDMCKAVDKHMVISQVYVKQKQGGKHDFKIQ
ncbi:hypothetical protein TRICI_001498 [Trichomonascus ciferrii]|uniref:cyclic pyranopterin monophosphate synthase n=1 Tax=Trichomonascus ciferrii TaxID=44093 RepID=A0A642VCE1_9ASCO|nr:hypothetical protein TRICI_001498 [Trichomonascus ciferrii]